MGKSTILKIYALAITLSELSRGMGKNFYPIKVIFGSQSCSEVKIMLRKKIHR